MAPLPPPLNTPIVMLLAKSAVYINLHVYICVILYNTVYCLTNQNEFMQCNHIYLTDNA